MPSPPRKGESKKHFISRAIKYLIKEGYEKDRAAAIAYKMWRKHKNKKKKGK